MSRKVEEMRDRLDRVVAAGSAAGIRAALKDIKANKGLVTFELLKSTRIGASVGKLRKDRDPEIAAVAKEIVDAWKELKEELVRKPEEGQKKRAAAGDAEKMAPAKKLKKTVVIDGEDTQQRQSVRKALALLLKRGKKESDVHSPETASLLVENWLYRKYKDDMMGENSGYVTHYRVLRDVIRSKTEMWDGSKELVRDYIMKCDTVDKAMEFDFAEQKKRIDKDMDAELTKAAGALKENVVIYDTTEKIASPFFTCPECGAKEVHSYAVQIQSPDQPATNMCTCLKCNHMWRDGDD